MSHDNRQSAAHSISNLSPALRFVLLLSSFFLLEVVAHVTLLRLPYYWDEAGYYIPAAYDFFRTGTLIPFSTLTNAHPPVLSLYLALLWKIFGFAPLVTRVGMCLVSALSLVAVFELAHGALKKSSAAFAVVLLTATYPVWFAQSSLAHADVLACAATLWALVFAMRPLSRYQHPQRLLWAAAGCFAIAALTKEISIGTPLALAAWEALLLVHARLAARRDHSPAAPGPAPALASGSWRKPLILSLPVLPLAAWFAYHRWRTGFTFGNPEYLRYNATATLTPARVLLALAHRVMHLSLHLNLFVPVVIAMAALLLPRLPGRAHLLPALRAKFWVILVANALLFSLLGGALLTRYLLPMYPLVLLLAVSAIYSRFQAWLWYPALGVVAFTAALFLPPLYRVAPEDTLAYRNAVVLEQDAIAFVANDFPNGPVLSAWPVTDALRKPELGYVRRPLSVVPIDNFSLPALQQLTATSPKTTESADRSYSTAIVFSTKYDPPGLPFRFGRWNEEQEERYFDFHHDLSAAAVASLLGGTVVWQEHRGGLWAAVLRFNHPQLARVAGPSYNQREPEPYARSPRS